MTETDWLTCADPTPMLEFLLAGRASERKARLFAVACCRRIWHLLTDQGSRKALEVIERYADGMASEADLESATTLALEPVLARSFCSRSPKPSAGEAVPGAVWYAANRAISWEKTTRYVAEMTARANDLKAEQKVQAVLLRDIFGNPYRPVVVERSWLSPKVVGLAQAIYDDRAFDRLPVLAAALEEAGCNDAAILSHCRQAGPHFRGCWVVDLLLEKE